MNVNNLKTIIMKKLILTLAFLASGFSVIAFPSEVLPLNSIIKTTTQGFEEVSLDELPEVVATAIQKNYANATLAKAYKNKKDQYKLKLIVEEIANIVFIDKEGNWLEEKDVKTVGGK